MHFCQGMAVECFQGTNHATNVTSCQCPYLAWHTLAGQSSQVELTGRIPDKCVKAERYDLEKNTKRKKEAPNVKGNIEEVM